MVFSKRVHLVLRVSEHNGTIRFRDESGKIWEPGKLVWVESAFLDIAQDMLIERVSYQQDDGGSIATISLTDPRSYGGEGGKGNKSGSTWSRDNSEAE